MHINHNLTESDIDKIDVRSPLEHQKQQQEMKDFRWIFDKIISMILYFNKTGELNGSNYVKFPLRSNAILNFENIDKFCFYGQYKLFYILVIIIILTEFQNIKKYFDELNTEGFDFTNGFKFSDVHKFDKLNNLFINIFELNFYQDQNKGKHKIIPIEVTKTESDRVIDFLIYKNHYALNKKLNVFLGDHQKIFIWKRCLNSYTSEIMLMILKRKCKNIDITTIRTSLKSHLL